MLKHFSNTDLSTLFAFSFFSPPMDPMMQGFSLFTILPDANVSKGWFAGELRSVHQDRNAAGVGDYLAGRALHSWSMLLLENKHKRSWAYHKIFSVRNKKPNGTNKCSWLKSIFCFKIAKLNFFQSSSQQWTNINFFFKAHNGITHPWRGSKTKAMKIQYYETFISLFSFSCHEKCCKANSRFNKELQPTIHRILEFSLCEP